MSNTVEGVREFTYPLYFSNSIIPLLHCRRLPTPSSRCLPAHHPAPSHLLLRSIRHRRRSHRAARQVRRQRASVFFLIFIFFVEVKGVMICGCARQTDYEIKSAFSFMFHDSPKDCVDQIKQCHCESRL